MMQNKDLPCWEIMQCNPENAKQCPAYNSPSPCWEVMQKLDAYSFNICRDCIVYVIKQNDAVLSREELIDIMHQKGMGADGGIRCPQDKLSPKDNFISNS